MARREYQAGRPTTLTGSGLNSTALSFTIAEAFNWPDGAGGTLKFWVTVDPGTAQEERLLCTGLSGLTVTIDSLGRGVDGTGARSHAFGAVVWPSWSATDADEANEHINASTNVHGVTGSIAPLASPTFTGTVVLPSTTSIGNVSSTELGYLDGVTSAVQTQLNNNTPTGSIAMWALATAPTGWQICNGDAAATPALATVLGTANVPDMRGFVPVGFKSGDDAFGTLKGTGGSKTSTAEHTHSLSAHTHALGNHTHSIDHDHGAFNTTGGEGGHSHAINIEIAGSLANGGLWLAEVNTTPRSDSYMQSAGAHNHSIDVPNFGGTSGGPSAGSNGPSTDVSGASSVSAANGNLQPYFTINFIIKT